MKKKKRRSKRTGKSIARALQAPKRDVRYSEGSSVPALLQRAAGALNYIESASVRVRLAHGALITDYGYVFWVDGRWVVRDLQLAEPDTMAGDDDE
jgi:hypothetical protein